MRIEFTLLIFKEGTTFVSFCPELGVSSCGDTVEDARRRGNEAVKLFLEETSRMGTLKEVLEEEGFTEPHRNEWLSPPLISTEHSQVAI